MTEKKAAVRVLLADDHPHGREGMREIVGNDPAFEIVGEAVNGEQAVAMAIELEPDLVLMDINMPVMNGMEATYFIKNADPRIKIVMVTVSDDITDLFEAIKRGAQGYLLKNLSPSAWLEYLRAVAVDEAPLSKELAFRMLQEFNGYTEEPSRRSGAVGGGDADGGSGIGGSKERQSGNDGIDGIRERLPRDGGAGRDAAGGNGFAAGGSTRGSLVNAGGDMDQAGAAAGRAAAGGSGYGEAGRTPLTQREREVLERVASGDSNRLIAETFGLSEHTIKNHLKNILQKLHLENRVQLTRYAMEQGLFKK